MNSRQKNKFPTSTGDPDNLRRKAITFLHSKGAISNGCFLKHRRHENYVDMLEHRPPAIAAIAIVELQPHNRETHEWYFERDDTFFGQSSVENSRTTFQREF